MPLLYSHELITPHGDLKPDEHNRFVAKVEAHYPSWGFETAVDGRVIGLARINSLPLMGI